MQILHHLFKRRGGLILSQMLLICLPAAISIAQPLKTDIQHYDISLTNIDYTGKSISAQTVITFKCLNAADSLVLDLWELTVTEVIDSVPLVFKQYGEKLSVHFSSKTIAGGIKKIRIAYSGKPLQDATWGGFTFSGAYAFNLGVGFTSNPHNLGRVWFPCIDNFTDKATYSFHITVPPGYKAFCNGTLDSVVNNIWHWSFPQAIPTYLASVAVAPYTTTTQQYKGTQITLNALAGDSLKMVQSFKHLHDALDAFENRYGPHRFNRAGFNAVPFSGGAMEHATNIAYPLFAIDGTTNYETLYAHELSHHWWGNNVTCRADTFMWLNEGWAAYSERLFLEWVYGRDAYKADISSNHRNVLHYAHLRDGGAWPVGRVDHDRTYGMHVYDKGADMVHTLRGYMGDSAFFAACKHYMDYFAFGNADNEGLKSVFQQHTTRNLDAFFRYWIENAGSTAFSILEWQTRDVGPAVRTEIRIKQNLRMAPELYREVPVELTFFDNAMNRETHELLLGGLDTTYVIVGGVKPVYIALDLDEKISDAITDKALSLRDTGSYNFVDALMNIKVNELTDSAFMRVEHFWTAPDNYYNQLPGVQLSTRRYWQVDGVWPEGLKANATIEYNGRLSGTNYAAGYLDDDLVILNEDSLLLLYRPHAAAYWQQAAGVTKGSGTNLDRKGTFTINELKKGQYALAIRNTTTSGINKESKNAFRIYPNPSNGQIQINFAPLESSACLEITDSLGRKMKQVKLQASQEHITVKTDGLKAGFYWVNIVGEHSNYQPQKFLVE